MKKTLLLTLMALLAGTFLSGCMINHRSHLSDSSYNHPISRLLLDSIEPGVTTKDWVIDTFGKPDREKNLQDGEEILIYENTRHKSSDFSLFLLIDSHSSEDIKEVLSFKIKDGIVESYSLD